MCPRCGLHTHGRERRTSSNLEVKALAHRPDIPHNRPEPPFPRSPSPRPPQRPR
ncbi:hypothetical protein STAFG_2636 [Streptomyces afghaniensis 772]|uniref:Uncharacterized protein n=1 Tax=Streptomyces afghaniensis 772 TaxID=1283301 RepID=S4N155_9ACTN|nr:hypothetical protein STAFG_2636 [Streptomyces afghaniensis 772]